MIENEKMTSIKSSYIDYSMSVIVSRALPDVRDGLKPVHRRVLYGMFEQGAIYNKHYKSSGIAVGMATNMPPHNIVESIEAICSYIDKKNITIEELMKYIKAPDFPTGGIIYGYEGVKEA